MILDFDDFAKLDIKIGTIVECEHIPETDKLMQVVLDFGQYKKQVVAGFGFKFKPEDLIGKQAPVVLNIKPTKIREVLSEGIFIAVAPDNDVVLLLPEEKIPNGSKVK